MSDILTDALKGAAAAVAQRSDVHLKPEEAEAVASAIAENLPAPKALEPLWPQLARYGVSMVGAALAANGLGSDLDWQGLANAVASVAFGHGTEADWQVVIGGVLALAPPLWRTATTWLARQKSA